MDKSFEKENQYPVLYVASGKTYSLVLFQLLQDLEYSEETVVLRMFDKNRKSLVLKTGTDRDTDSINWLWQGCDSNLEQQLQHGIGVKDLIYAHCVEVQELISRNSHTSPSSQEERFPASVANFSSSDDLYSALAVYRGSALTRAANAEYWFDKDPRKALIALLFEKTVSSSPPILNEYDLHEIAGLTTTPPTDLLSKLNAMLKDLRWQSSSGIVIGGPFTHHKWVETDSTSPTIEYLPVSGYLAENRLFRYSLKSLIENGAITNSKTDIDVHNAIFNEMVDRRVKSEGCNGFSSDEIPHCSGARVCSESHFYRHLPSAQEYEVPFHSTNTVFILNLRQPDTNLTYQQLTQNGFRYVYGVV